MKNKVVNLIKVKGYLKENNLEFLTDSKGGKVARGSVTIALNATQAYKVQFYANEFTKGGSASKTYTNLLNFMPGKVMSISQFLKDNEGANYDTAKANATKVWITGSLEEWATKNEAGKVDSRSRFKGIGIGVDTKPTFEPEATFEVDVYIKNIKEETVMEDDEPVETGRLIIEGITPTYDGACMYLNYVTDPSVTEYIKDHYNQYETATIRGKLVNLMIKEEKETANTGFGMKSISNSAETKFIDERVILGGDSDSKLCEDDDAVYGFSKAEIKECLVKRTEVIENNTKKKKESDAKKAAAEANKGFTNNNASPFVQTPTATKDFGFDDDDF